MGALMSPKRQKEVIFTGICHWNDRFMGELNVKMDKFAMQMAKKHPKSLSEMVLAVRMEEDETL
ncbi:MAG: hypothetical protein L6244_03220 [Candidatus Methanoperedenaceae archaeon]|nr:hypothetical protein [Candidatus Methanoperedenaceae archaeon]